MNKEISDKLLKLVAQSMPGVDMTGANENSRIIEDLRYDSLGLFTLVRAVEKEFSIKFDEYYQINTIKDIYDYVVSHQK